MQVYYWVCGIVFAFWSIVLIVQIINYEEALSYLGLGIQISIWIQSENEQHKYI
ncbi:hypothetical protein C2G38_2083104 [Gigaspora rosea]|uniref:Uncharacterized protein n=1 Tax=Gigaspora rosea TaxID=44941 RepID=A0A397VC81_9GLOM|nr:hypothetical protein C2G38_2083104 [Gigaspora rosea]